MGLLNNLIPASLIVWGQTMIPSGLASVIIATTPIFSIIAIHLSSADEQLTLAKISAWCSDWSASPFYFASS